MRIYVAGGSTESARCRAFMNRLREAGHIITMDWVEHMEESGAADHLLGEARVVDGAQRDLDGVQTADVVVFLAPAQASRGMQTELGFALASRKQTIAVGNVHEPLAARGLGLFGALVGSWFHSDAAAIAALTGGRL
jgi:nucleoside 2-deoxyribosyltransferase